MATFLMLQGLNLGITKAITDTVLVSGVGSAGGYGSAHAVFASTVDVAGTGYRITILWWLVLTAVASYVLLRTRFGNSC